jgi:hypothetical protein
LPSGEHKVEVDISLYDHGDDKKVLEDVKYTIDLNVQDEI